MDKYKLDLNDVNYNFFHFTQKRNLDSIKENGLIPKIGAHAKYLEKTPKVFFVEGLDNLLILFDCWINVYAKIPLFPITYGLGSKCLRFKYFPKFIADIYFKWTTVNKSHKKYAHQVFDQLLEECILLNLDLKEGLDFNSNDQDEIKTRGYRKSHLIIMGYSEAYSDMDSTCMDKWNMHTLSEHGIPKDKIKLCYINDSCKMMDILMFALNHTGLNLEKICPVLYEYLESRNLLSKIKDEKATNQN